MSISAIVKFRVRSLKRGKSHLLCLPLSITIKSWQEVPLPASWSTPPRGVRNFRVMGMRPSRACTLLYRTRSEPRNSLSTWPQSLHGSLPQVHHPKVGCVVCMHRLGGSRSSQRTVVCVVCRWGLVVQAGYPQMCVFGPVWGKEAGVGRERRWATGQFSLCLHVIKWNPDPKLKFPCS